jgi:capsular polysaccharide biosynthesis protein
MCCVDSSLLPSIAHITLLPGVLTCPAMDREGNERVIDDPVLFLAGQGSRAPFHWPHDALTRLLAFEHSGESAQILVPSHLARSQFIQESLQLLGIPEDRIAYLNPNERIRAREVWLAEDLAPHEQKLNALLGMLRSRMLEAVECDPTRSLSRDEGRNIYISRQGAPAKRGVQNAEEFLALAQKFGFEEHRMETVSLRDQIRLAAETTRVLAPHGAGLFNTLYMSGGEVVELFPVDARGKETNTPCWQRLLDVHASHGRTVSWRAIESEIIRSSEKDLDFFSIVADLSKTESELRAPHAPPYNTWNRI